VVLALHPGTRAALDAAGLALPGVAVVEPQGYRSSLALQLHAAAVLTDSGGVQRESAWLGVPCLVLRTTTEWVETVGGAGSSAVLIGLDAKPPCESWPSGRPGSRIRPGRRACRQPRAGWVGRGRANRRTAR
jgi:hypothetical protein